MNNYCIKCGRQLSDDDKYCHSCGKSLYETSKIIDEDKSTPTLIATCSVIGFLFPIIGAILYYSYLSSAPKAAKAANSWSWFGFLLYGLFGFIYILRYIFIII